MRTQNTRLTRRCPQCGGRGQAEARLPVGSAARPGELDLDDPRGLTERFTFGVLLALVEALPYKTFLCPRCGHEFRMENRSRKEQLFSMLAAMQPVAATPPEARPAPRAVSRTARVPAVSAQPMPPARAGLPPPLPSAVPAAPAHAVAAEEWEPYHLDHDLDALFDQFEAPDSQPAP